MGNIIRYIRNGVADSLADDAANLGELDCNKPSRVIDYTHLVKKIQLRLATILCNPPSRDKPKKVAKDKLARIALDTAIELSQHSLYSENGVLKCCVCMAQASTSSPIRWIFFNSDCHPAKVHSITQPIIV